MQASVTRSSAQDRTRISRVQVSGLFGVFDHEVPLNRGERVTIIHGPNGFGKTLLLRLIDAVFNGRTATLRTVPFQRLDIDLEPGNRTLTVAKAASNGKGSPERITMSPAGMGRGTRPYTIPILPDDAHSMPLSFVDRLIPGLDRVTASSWRYLPTNELLSYEDVIERFADALDPMLREYQIERRPEWLEKLKDSVHVRLIDTQRLQTSVSSTRRTRQEHLPTPAVAAYAEDLAKQIQAKLAESATISQSLDRSFPARVVGKPVPVTITDQELRDELSALEKRRNDLREAGLLDTESGSEFQVPPEIDEHAKAILSVYVDDVKTKLSIFDDLAARTDLFKRILNARFQYKELIVNKDSGYVFRTPDGKILSPRFLSSGEQHELVLLYELLFKVESPSLVLIDEPELSLHVAWQQAFLRDLQEVAQLGEFDVLLATHSPQIISDRWDVTVELKGPERPDARNA